MDERGAAGIGLGVHELERAPKQGLLARRVARLVRGHGGVAQELELVDPCELLRVGHPLPERERALEERLRLGEGVHALGGQPGARRGRERARLVAGRDPVVRHLRGDVRAALAALDPLLERAARGRRASRSARPAAGPRRPPRAAARGGSRSSRRERSPRCGSPPPRAARRAGRRARAPPRPPRAAWSAAGWQASQRISSCARGDSRSTRSISASRSVGGSAPRPSSPAARISSA